MRVSVAISTFNGVPYISEQLDSILAQTRCPDEIVIRDDSSSDTTVMVLKEYEKKNNGIIKVINDGHRLGCDKSFIECIRNTSGDVIFPCDQDDIWLPTKIETMLRYLESNNYDLVYAQDYDFYQETGVLVEAPVSLPPLDKSIYYCYLKGHTCAFRRHLISLFDFNGLITWDYYLAVYSVASGRYAECREFLMKWRRHSSSQTFAASQTEMTASAAKQDGKWETCKNALLWLAKGNKSECIAERFSARALFLDFLSSGYPVSKETRKYSKVLWLISQQTVTSVLRASVISAFLSLFSKDSRRQPVRIRLARMLHDFRTPASFIFTERNKLAL